MTRLILPLPPSVNHSHKQWVNKGRIMRLPTDDTKSFYTEAGWLAEQWSNKNQWTLTQKQKVIMRYWCYWPDRRKRDAGNIEKVLSDSLKGILFDDDRYLLPRAMDYSIDKQNPRVEVEFEVMK